MRINRQLYNLQIVAALTEQAGRLTLTSRAFYNDVLGEVIACQYRVH